MGGVEAAALAAIEGAIDAAGDVDMACARARSCDPLLRGRVRRRVRLAVLEASSATKHKSDDAHVLRLAWLSIARAPFDRAAIDDLDAIRTAFDEARANRPKPASWWWRSAVLATALVGAFGAAVALNVEIGGASTHLGSSGAFAPPADARMSGESAVVAHALSRDVPDLLIAIDRRNEAARAGDAKSADATVAAARDKILGDAALKEALGARATDALARLLDAADAGGKPSATAGDEQSKAILLATAAFDDALAARGLPYFVDGDLIVDLRTDKRVSVLYSFHVEKVSTLESNGKVVRAVHVRRIDDLNWSHALLGFTRRHLDVAVVLLDQIDEELASFVLPGIAKGARLKLFDEDQQQKRDDVETRAGQALRDELVAAAGVGADVAAQLGKELARRRDLLDQWEKIARSRGLVLSRPAKVNLDVELAKSVRGTAPDAQVDELLDIDRRLEEKDMSNAYAALRDRLVAAVEIHEAQHRLDFSRDKELVMPPELERYSGASERDGDLPSRARAELSAYLAELARDERTTRTSLTLLAHFLFSQRMQGTAECYAALVAFEQLAVELGMAKRVLVVSRAIDRDAAADLYLAMLDRPPADLRAAAKRSWETLYRDSLPPLVER